MRDFRYARASSVAGAIVAKRDGVKFVAGGTNLVDLIKYGAEQPDELIDITHLPLKEIEEMSNGGLRVGTLVPNSDLAAHPIVASRYPVLRQALLSGASPQLRNMATTGGNLLQRTRCYYFMDPAFPCNKRNPGSGCPAIQGQNRIHAILGTSDSCIATHPSDMAVALAALEAIIHVQGAEGERSIPISDFHRLPGDTPQLDTTLRSDELITWIEIPSLPDGTRSHYLKVRDRAEYQFALVSAAVVLRKDGGTIESARIALGGVAHKPWRATDVEEALMGQPSSLETYRNATSMSLKQAKGYGQNDFKIELAKRAMVRALVESEDHQA